MYMLADQEGMNYTQLEVVKHPPTFGTDSDDLKQY